MRTEYELLRENIEWLAKQSYERQPLDLKADMAKLRYCQRYCDPKGCWGCGYTTSRLGLIPHEEPQNATE